MGPTVGLPGFDFQVCHLPVWVSCSSFLKSPPENDDMQEYLRPVFISGLIELQYFKMLRNTAWHISRPQNGRVCACARACNVCQSVELK